MKYLALDFETSGTSPDQHAPVSLGVALMDGAEVLDSREWLFAPPRHYKTQKITRAYDVNALEISRYTWTQIKRDGLPHAQVVDELRKWAIQGDAQDLLIVAFNAPFDFSFFSTTLFLAGEYDRTRYEFCAALPPLFGPWQCAMMLAKRHLFISKYTLDEVCMHFEIAREGDRHSALEDAILAGQIYARLLEIAVAKAGAA